jgi:hypothetical protein
MKLKRKYIGCLMLGWLLAFSAPSFAQYLPTHISNQGIYLFLDELATEKIIDLHSLVRPYARKDIAGKLVAADSSRAVMTRRQQAELDFYLGDYRKDLPVSDVSEYGSSWMGMGTSDRRFDVFYYRDSLFRMTVNPILGSDFWSNENGNFYHWWNGVEASSTIGKFGIWASLRDNHESTELTARDFLNDRIGASNIKGYGDGKRDYWELRAGISYGWDWGHVGLIMGQFAWGENNAGANIFSGRTPAFPRLELAMNPAPWFRFTYVHGALVSEVVDSTLSFYTSTAYGSDYHLVYHPKYLAANIFTFVPVKGLQLSVGNSVIYDYRHPHAAFLLPVAFYKAIDHTLNARINNMNSQLFLSVSSRNLKHLHLYTTVFLDEVAVDRAFDSEEHNFVSYKAGAATTLIPNTRFWVEYTWTNALTFMHFVPTTTFESNQYNLGHYLEDNARQFYLGAEFRPIRTLNIRAWYSHSEKGPDHTAMGTMPRQGTTALEPIVWESASAGILASCQLVNDLYLRLGYEWRNVSGLPGYLNLWTPEVYHGQTGTLRLGLNYGF